MVSKESVLRDIDFYWEASETEDLKLRISVLDSINELDLSNDAVAILTEWEAFKSLDFSKTIVFDGRGILSSSTYSIGKG
jgi:UDP-glucose 6-dehydrogenase